MIDNPGAVTKVTFWGHKIDMVSVQDTTEIERECQFLYNHVAKEKLTSDGWRLRAKIPLQSYMNLKRQGILQDQKKFRAWLNDPNNRVWQTTKGRF